MPDSPYRFRNNPAKGRRYSIWAKFTCRTGTRTVLEWFDTMADALKAEDEMLQDGRFSPVASYVRSQEAADAG